MIVVEGCDGCGKTTLVNHLSKKFGLEVGKRGVADRDRLYEVTRKDTYNHLARAVWGGSPPQVLDRLFVSEFVYADIVNRPNEFNSYERDFVVNVMNALGFPVIICLPPLAVVEANVSKTEQMAGVNENLHTIYQRYAEDDLPWPENTLWYDYTGKTPHFSSLEEVEEEVAGYIEHRHGREAWPHGGNRDAA